MNLLANYRRLRRRQVLEEIKGFTLIELLVVIVVLGILAAVVLFALGGITGESAIASCQADGATVTTAMQAYTTENPSKVPTVIGLLTGVDANNTVYLQSWPSNEPHYQFGLTTDGQLAIQLSGSDIWTGGETGAPASALPGTTAGGEPYKGPGTCANVA